MNDVKPVRMLCRRGLKELDLLLQFYLDNHYQFACREEISAFNLLLQMDDQSLLSLILNPPKEDSMVLLSLYEKLNHFKP